MQSIGTRIAAIGGIVTAPIMLAVRSVVEFGSAITKTAVRTGLSVEALSSLGFAAERSGADLETLEVGFRGMAKSLFKAEEGSKRAVKMLEKFGLPLKTLRAMSPEEQFLALADVLAKIENPTTRAGLAMQLFGRAGFKLIPMLAKGRAGIAALQQEAGTLGRTMSTEDAEAAAALAGSWGRLKSIMTGVRNVIGSAVVPTILQASNTVKEWGIRVVGFVKNNREMIVTLFKAALAVTAIGTGLAAVGSVIVGVGAVFGTLAGVTSAAASAFGVIVTVIGALLTPIGLVTAAVVGLVGYFAWSSGSIGAVVDWLKAQFTDLAGWVGNVFAGIRDALAAGDLALAGRVAMAGLRVAWEAGLGAIRRVWAMGINAVLETVYGLKYGMEEAVATAFYSVLTIGDQGVGGLQIGWALAIAGMKAAWQTFTSAIREGFAGVGVAAQKMKVYLDWAKSGNPFSYKYQQAKIADIDAQAAKEKAARKNQDAQAMAAIFNETTARIQGTVAATQAELDAQRARQRFGKQMREDLFAGEMAALDASTNEALNAAEANLANAQGELAASVAAARSKAAVAAGDNTRGAGLPEIPAPGDLAAAAAGAGAKGSIAGSFSALALAGMGNRNAADRTAKATEESAGHLRKIVKGQKANRFVFTGDASP